jgi:hypothetical protein
MTTTEPATTDDAGELEPYMQGRFALARRPDGAVVVAYRPDDADAGQFTIPAAIFEAPRRIQAGEHPMAVLPGLLTSFGPGGFNPLDLLKGLQG